MRPANFSIDRKASATTPTILRDNLRHRKAFCKACFSILVEAKPTRCLSCTCRGHLSLCCIPSEVLMINSTDYLKVFSATPSDAEGHFARMRMNLQQLLTFNFIQFFNRPPLGKIIKVGRMKVILFIGEYVCK